MFFNLFKSKKEVERVAVIDATSLEIEKIKARKAAEAARTAQEIAKLNNVVKAHGISGVLYLAMGGIEKK